MLLWDHAPSVADILLLQKNIVITIRHAGPMNYCQPLFKEL